MSDFGERPALERARIERAGGAEDDWLAVEEPLEIRLDGEPLAVTLRTPGHDRELAAGFLVSEGVIERREQIEAIERCRDPLAYDPDNTVDVRLAADAGVDPRQRLKARRELVAMAACGLCGKARRADLYQQLPEIEPMRPPDELVRRLPGRMRRHQELFDATGGLHAAALFDARGELLALREDVGRHNAVDKLIGRALLAGELPWRRRILAVSARAGFEIVQKALMAGAPVLVAVGAASSLAARTARDHGMELYTFVSERRANRHL